jgi:putative ABC transport system substrate-binding protein
LRKIILLILALLFTAGPAAAYEVLVVQSLRHPAYDEVLRGFRSVCAAESRVLVLSDYAEADVARIVREDRPRLVLTLGDGALKAVRKVRQTPVVAVMALGLRGPRGARANLTGIDMLIPPERYLPLFAAFKAKKTGTLYDPAKTGPYVNRGAAAFRQEGEELVARVVRDPKETLGRLAGLGGKGDSFWLIPDTTAVTRETLPAYFHFTQEQLVPLVSFTALHLGYGAAVVLEFDRADMGKQAGEMALSLFRGASPADIPLASPRKATVRSNHAVLKRLGFSPELFD